MPASPTAPAPTPSVKERLASVHARLTDPANARKPYRLRVVSTRERPAPFVAVTVAGHTFHETSSRMVEDAHGKMRRVEQEGLVEFLTDAEVAKVRARIEDYFVRWLSKPNGTAHVIDGANVPAERFGGFQEGDEMLAPYVSIEAVEPKGF